MNCSCIKGEYNFFIYPDSCGKVIYKDLSTWMEGDYYIPAEEYILTIKSPLDITSTITIKTDSPTILNSSELFSTECFIDGIYCFSTTSCGISYQKNKAILCNTECRMANLVREASILQSDNFWEKVIKLKASLDSIYAHAELNNFESANNEYNILKKELDKLNCNC